jgi:prevent-host-death family protein
MAATMDEAVSIADASRRLSRILREVREGYSYVVTSRGRPVARIVPAASHEGTATRLRAALMQRLERQPVVDVGRLSRDELYEDDR